MPALQARLCNKAMRKWQNALVGYGTDPAPTIVLVNQTRIDVGIMWGSKIVRTGGRGHLFAGTIDIELRRGKHPTGKWKGKDIAFDTNGRAISKWIKFIITKCLCGPPKAEGGYPLNLRAHTGRSPATTDDEWAVANFAEMTEMFVPNEEICGKTFAHTVELVKEFFEDKDYFFDVRQALMDFLLEESTDWMRFRAWKRPGSPGSLQPNEIIEEDEVDFD